MTEAREPASVSDCRRALGAARDILGPTAFQEMLGRELTEVEEARQRLPYSGHKSKGSHG